MPHQSTDLHDNAYLGSYTLFCVFLIYGLWNIISSGVELRVDFSSVNQMSGAIANSGGNIVGISANSSHNATTDISGVSSFNINSHIEPTSFTARMQSAASPVYFLVLLFATALFFASQFFRLMGLRIRDRNNRNQDYV